jgi:hypothetical protein
VEANDLASHNKQSSIIKKPSVYTYYLYSTLNTCILKNVVSAFRPRGSLDRRVKLSLRVPAQMGWREMEHKGDKTWLVLSCARGDALAVGVTSVREGERESEPVR